MKDENSKDKVIQMKISEILYKTFIFSSKWNYALENKILPIINQYICIKNTFFLILKLFDFIYFKIEN